MVVLSTTLQGMPDKLTGSSHGLASSPSKSEALAHYLWEWWQDACFCFIVEENGLGEDRSDTIKCWLSREAGEMAWCLGARTALPGDLSWVPI